MSAESRIIVPPGTVETNAYYPQPSNKTISPYGRVEVTKERNAASYLQEHVANPDHPDQVAWTPLGIDGVVHTMNPSQGWREGAKMINAFPAVLLGPEELVPVDEKGMFRTILNYDGPMTRQVEYARHSLASIDAMEDALDELYRDNHSIRPDLAPEVPLVIVMENANSEVSTQFVHSSRTLATPHEQVLPNGFGVNTAVIPTLSIALQMERRLKGNYPYGSKVVEEIDGDLKEALGRNAAGVDIYASPVNSPLEYTIDTGIARGGNLMDSAVRLAQIEQAHYGVNKTIMTAELAFAAKQDESFARMYRRRGMKPYSNRHTKYYAPNDEGKMTLHMDVSPAIFGGGATEDKLVAPDRHPRYPQLMPTEVRRKFDENFAKGLTTRLSAAPSISPEGVLFKST